MAACDWASPFPAPLGKMQCHESAGPARTTADPFLIPQLGDGPETEKGYGFRDLDMERESGISPTNI